MFNNNGLSSPLFQLPAFRSRSVVETDKIYAPLLISTQLVPIPSKERKFPSHFRSIGAVRRHHSLNLGHPENNVFGVVFYSE